MKPTTYEELQKSVKDKQIVSAKSKDYTYRFFISTGNLLCYFAKGSSRKGRMFGYSQFEELLTFQVEKIKTEGDKRKKQYNDIAKYKRLAMEAKFTNSFIEDCKKLPTFDKWAEEGAKGLYELGITTGNKIDGKVISLERIGKQYPSYIERLKFLIENQSEGSVCSSTPFAGYDMSLSTAKNEVGEFFGYLSLEFKGCRNGYYYLLINDKNFIGYDVD